MFSQPKPPTFSLFTNPSNNSTSTSQPQSQPSQPGGLFSNLNTSQPQQQTSQPSLFGNLGASSNPPASSNLFAGLGAPRPQQAPSNASNLSGTTLNNNSNTTAQPSQSQGLFGQSQAQGASNEPGQAGQQNGQSMQEAESGFRPAYFNSLLEKNRKRAREAEGGTGLSEIPSLQLGLGDIAKRVRELGGTGAQANGRKGADSKA